MDALALSSSPQVSPQANYFPSWLQRYCYRMDSCLDYISNFHVYFADEILLPYREPFLMLQKKKSLILNKEIDKVNVNARIIYLTVH